MLIFGYLPHVQRCVDMKGEELVACNEGCDGQKCLKDCLEQFEEDIQDCPCGDTCQGK